MSQDNLISYNLISGELPVGFSLHFTPLLILNTLLLFNVIIKVPSGATVTLGTPHIVYFFKLL